MALNEFEGGIADVYKGQVTRANHQMQLARLESAIQSDH